MLAHGYEDGSGAELDLAEAGAWFRRAARHGNAGGAFNLGIHYRDGTGARRDRSSARHGFERGVAAGSPSAPRALRELGRSRTRSPRRGLDGGGGPG